MADIAKDPAKEAGKIVLFIGIECQHWTPAQFAAAAKFARAHGVDTICPKRADGTIKWYGTPERLEQERAAVTAEGVGYLPFAYCYGPHFGERQVREECAMLAEMAGANANDVCADLEAEWDGSAETIYQTYDFGHISAPALFQALMRPVPCLLYLTTFADPVQQNFPVRQLAPCVNAWVPQDYNNWLAACEQQQITTGMSIRFAAYDLSQEFGANNVVENVAHARALGHPSCWLWEYQMAVNNPGLLDQCVKAFKGEQTVTADVHFPVAVPALTLETAQELYAAEQERLAQQTENLDLGKQAADQEKLQNDIRASIARMGIYDPYGGLLNQPKDSPYYPQVVNETPATPRSESVDQTAVLGQLVSLMTQLQQSMQSIQTSLVLQRVQPAPAPESIPETPVTAETEVQPSEEPTQEAPTEAETREEPAPEA